MTSAAPLIAPPDALAGRSPDALAAVEDLGIRRGGRWLVRHVDLTVRRGEIVTLVGPNGGGKTTAAKALLGLIRPDEGRSVRLPGLTVGYVPQRLAIDWTLPLTVRRLMRLTGRIADADLAAALEAVGMTGFANAPVQGLSGGEFQRALLARAIARRPQLLVLDEPVQGVDFAGELALYDLIAEVRDRLRCGVLLISHDLHIVMARTDTVVCLDGEVACRGAPLAVAESPIYRRLFGRRAAGTIAVYTHDHHADTQGAAHAGHAAHAHDHEHDHAQ